MPCGIDSDRDDCELPLSDEEREGAYEQGVVYLPASLADPERALERWCEKQSPANLRLVMELSGGLRVMQAREQSFDGADAPRTTAEEYGGPYILLGRLCHRSLVPSAKVLGSYDEDDQAIEEAVLVSTLERLRHASVQDIVQAANQVLTLESPAVYAGVYSRVLVIVYRHAKTGELRERGIEDSAALVAIADKTGE